MVPCPNEATTHRTGRKSDNVEIAADAHLRGLPVRRIDTDMTNRADVDNDGNEMDDDNEHRSSHDDCNNGNTAPVPSPLQQAPFLVIPVVPRVTESVHPLLLYVARY